MQADRRDYPGVSSQAPHPPANFWQPFGLGPDGCDEMRPAAPVPGWVDCKGGSSRREEALIHSKERSEPPHVGCYNSRTHPGPKLRPYGEAVRSWRADAIEALGVVGRLVVSE